TFDAPEVTTAERVQRASPASSTAGVAAQKSRAAACPGVIAGSGSRRRIQRKIASVASTTTAAALIRVQSSKVALSGVENCIGGAQLIPRASGTSQSIGPLAHLPSKRSLPRVRRTAAPLLAT